ncbi:N-acetylneuraminate synthase [Salibacterium salarium]|uniref:pseudaminic acid synthase n=1 Tax=Salibacterium salarium TaxID=284579 RepID=UPI00277FBD85|nr:pseudaminic acid synthase [Salibacterium salarium]MDQ0298230.1 N-acetylneuraminate synthase [Salibacterium salarium]
MKLIAELSGNHNQSLQRALQLVDEAANAGVDAVKLQTYTPDTMTLDVNKSEFMIDNKDSIWYGRNLYDLFGEAYTPWEWHKPIFDRCMELGLTAFSSPFDESAVDFLESLEVPAYKIASFEIVDIPLIKKVGETGKPVIMSTGMASLSEIEEAVETVRQAGCKDLTLLKCTSTYPASPEDSNLITIPHMKELFKCKVGLSDHTLGVGVSVASVALGASVIEKHFTISREDGGVDAAFSMEPEEMRQLVKEVDRANSALGQIQYGPVSKEKKAQTRRRSLYISKDMKKGDVLSEFNMRSIRPGLGLPPKYYDILLGKKITKSATLGTPLTWDYVVSEETVRRDEL